MTARELFSECKVLLQVLILFLWSCTTCIRSKQGTVQEVDPKFSVYLRSSELVNLHTWKSWLWVTSSSVTSFPLYVIVIVGYHICSLLSNEEKIQQFSNLISPRGIQVFNTYFFNSIDVPVWDSVHIVCTFFLKLVWQISAIFLT